MFPEWKADYTVPGPESVPEQLTPCDLTSPLSSDPLDFALQGPTLRSEGGPGPSSAPSTTPQSTSAKAAVGAKTATPVSVISQAGHNLTGNQASKVVARKRLEDCNNLATLTPSHNNLLLLAATAERKSGAVEGDVDTRKMTRVGNEPDTVSAPAQDQVAAELAADMSGASESSLVRNTVDPAMQEQFLRICPVCGRYTVEPAVQEQFLRIYPVCGRNTVEPAMQEQFLRIYPVCGRNTVDPAMQEQFLRIYPVCGRNTVDPAMQEQFLRIYPVCGRNTVDPAMQEQFLRIYPVCGRNTVEPAMQEQFLRIYPVCGRNTVDPAMQEQFLRIYPVCGRNTVDPAMQEQFLRIYPVCGRNTVDPATQEQFLRQITCLWETSFSWNQTSREKFYCLFVFLIQHLMKGHGHVDCYAYICVHVHGFFFCGCVFFTYNFLFRSFISVLA